MNNSNFANNVELRARTLGTMLQHIDQVGGIDHKDFRNGWRYLLSPLDCQVKEFGSDIYRIETTGCDNGCVVKIDLKKGTMSFMDNVLYVNNGIVKWSQPIKARLIVLYTD